MLSKIPENLEMIMVLGGKHPEKRPRSNKAMEAYRTYGRIPILLTASHSGLGGISLPKGVKKTCVQMRDYIVKEGVRDEDITLEDKSMDTLADFYYSFPLIYHKHKRSGLITDPAHMKRSLWCGRKVFADAVDFVPIQTNWEDGFGRIIDEFILLQVLKRELKDIRDGNYNALTKYMKDVHPFHAWAYGNKPIPSLYGLITEIAKKSKIKLRYDQ